MAGRSMVPAASQPPFINSTPRQPLAVLPGQATGPRVTMPSRSIGGEGLPGSGMRRINGMQSDSKTNQTITVTTQFANDPRVKASGAPLNDLNAGHIVFVARDSGEYQHKRNLALEASMQRHFGRTLGQANEELYNNPSHPHNRSGDAIGKTWNLLGGIVTANRPTADERARQRTVQTTVAIGGPVRVHNLWFETHRPVAGQVAHLVCKWKPRNQGPQYTNDSPLNTYLDQMEKKWQRQPDESVMGASGVSLGKTADNAADDNPDGLVAKLNTSRGRFSQKTYERLRKEDMANRSVRAVQYRADYEQSKAAKAVAALASDYTDEKFLAGDSKKADEPLSGNLPMMIPVGRDIPPYSELKYQELLADDMKESLSGVNRLSARVEEASAANQAVAASAAEDNSTAAAAVDAKADDKKAPSQVRLGYAISDQAALYKSRYRTATKFEVADAADAAAAAAAAAAATASVTKTDKGKFPQNHALSSRFSTAATAKSLPKPIAKPQVPDSAAEFDRRSAAGFATADEKYEYEARRNRAANPTLGEHPHLDAQKLADTFKYTEAPGYYQFYPWASNNSQSRPDPWELIAYPNTGPEVGFELRLGTFQWFDQTVSAGYRQGSMNKLTHPTDPLMTTFGIKDAPGCTILWGC